MKLLIVLAWTGIGLTLLIFGDRVQVWALSVLDGFSNLPGSEDRRRFVTSRQYSFDLKVAGLVILIFVGMILYRRLWLE